MLHGRTSAPAFPLHITVARSLSFVALLGAIATGGCTGELGADAPPGSAGTESVNNGNHAPSSNEPVGSGAPNTNPTPKPSGPLGTTGVTSNANPGPGPGPGQDPGPSPSGVVVPPPEPIDATVLTDCETPGPRILRRLSPTQYYRTLQAVFQDTQVPHEDVLSNPAKLGFHVDADTALIRDLDAELLMNYADSVATWAVENKLNQISSCTTNDAQCRRQFITTFGAKLHREPLSDAQITGYDGLFAAQATFQEGLQTALSAMLQSPLTIYRRELGTGSGSNYQLTPYEVASELSYMLTDGPPDQQLYDAAANNRLATAADVTREAERLMNSEQARETISNFVDGWLEIDKLHTKAKNETLKALPADLRVSLVQEVRELFLHLFFEGGKLSDLFTADYAYLDQKTAAFYNLSGPSGASFERVTLAQSDRPTGILGQGAWLTTHALADNSSPVQRAKVVIERLLCGTVPPVPQGLNTTLDTTSTFKTNRERYEQHTKESPCKDCHANLDPIGFAFENFDAFGQWRTQENGQEVNATGSIAQLTGGPYPLQGPDSLSVLLADSPQVQACLVRYWSYFAHGRDSWTNAACNRDAVIREARTQDFSLKSVLMGLVNAQHFTRRVADQ